MSRFMSVLSRMFRPQFGRVVKITNAANMRKECNFECIDCDSYGTETGNCPLNCNSES